MTQKPRKTRKMTAGDTLITRAELQFFAKAVDARIAQEIGKLREELTACPHCHGTGRVTSEDGLSTSCVCTQPEPA